MTAELTKFVEKLKKRNISNQYFPSKEDVGQELSHIDRIVFEHNGFRWIVIHGYGSIGCKNGLLEIWNGKDKPKGNLTADRAEEIIFG